MHLTTARLTIRPFTDADEAPMLRLLRNPRIAQTYMLPDFADDEAARPLFRRFVTLSNDPARAVVGLFDGDTLIGFMNDVSQEDGRIELGYVVDPAFHNRGYATEALTAMIAALHACGFRSVVCGAFDDNPASLRVMEKAGMRPIDLVETIEYRGKAHRCVYREACQG